MNHILYLFSSLFGGKNTSHNLLHTPLVQATITLFWTAKLPVECPFFHLYLLMGHSPLGSYSDLIQLIF